MSCNSINQLKAQIRMYQPTRSTYQVYRKDWQMLVSTNSEHISSLQERPWQMLVSTNSEHISSLQERLANVGVNQLGAHIKSTGKTGKCWCQPTRSTYQVYRKDWQMLVSTNSEHISSLQERLANVGVNQLGAHIKSTGKTVANVGVNQLDAQIKSTGKNDRYWYQPTRSTDKVYRKE